MLIYFSFCVLSVVPLVREYSVGTGSSWLCYVGSLHRKKEYSGSSEAAISTLSTQASHFQAEGLANENNNGMTTMT